jgi:hypothetical protein
MSSNGISMKQASGTRPFGNIGDRMTTSSVSDFSMSSPAVFISPFLPLDTVVLSLKLSCITAVFEFFAGAAGAGLVSTDFRFGSYLDFFTTLPVLSTGRFEVKE